MENIGLERGTGQGRRHPWRSVHLSREPCLEQGLPGPKTRSSSRPPPKNPRDQTRRKVQFLSSSSSSFFLFLFLGRLLRVCLLVCLLTRIIGPFSEKSCCAVFPPIFLQVSWKKKRDKREKEEFYFWKSWYADKVIIFSLSLSLLIFCLVRGSMIYIKIVLYDVGKWLKCIRDWKYKRKLRWSALSDFQTR